MLIRGWLVAASCLLEAGAVVAASAATDLDIATDSGPRHALVVLSGPGPRPTVVVLHGATGTAAGALRSTGFGQAATDRGFNAVFADGVDREWNDGRDDKPTNDKDRPDDVAFIRRLVARLIADHVAEPDRIYLAGISNGGMMTFTIACNAGSLFAGIGTVIANMPAGIEPCALQPMPVVMINGRADPIVPYDGGSVGLHGERGRVLSVDQTTALFAKVDGCSRVPLSRPLPKKDAAARTSATRIEWQGCAPGTSLTAYRVEGGGHALPGRAALGFGRLVFGETNTDFVAADAIMDVFARH